MSSSSLPQISSGGYQGLAAIAGNLAASLSDMLGSDTDDVTLGMEEDSHKAQQAQHGMPGGRAQQGHQAQQAQQSIQAQHIQQVHQAQQAQQGHQAQQAEQTQQVKQGHQGKQAQQEQSDVRDILPATASLGLTTETETSVNNHEAADQSSSDRAPSGSPPQGGATGDCALEVHASAVAQRLQERAAAAMALSEAATAPSSAISGLTDLQPQSVRLPALEAADPHIVRNSTDLHARAAAAIAALEAATAASSTVSGLSELQMQAAPDATAETTSSSVSGLTELRARAAAAAASDAALSEAAPAASSTVTGITELVAAGASLVDIAAALPAATAHPFGLSSAHSVDGYALANALSAPSSVVSDMTALLTDPPATVAMAPSDAPHEGGANRIAANHLPEL